MTFLPLCPSRETSGRHSKAGIECSPCAHKLETTHRLISPCRRGFYPDFRGRSRDSIEGRESGPYGRNCPQQYRSIADPASTVRTCAIKSRYGSSLPPLPHAAADPGSGRHIAPLPRGRRDGELQPRSPKHPSDRPLSRHRGIRRNPLPARLRPGPTSGVCRTGGGLRALFRSAGRQPVRLPAALAAAPCAGWKAQRGRRSFPRRRASP